MVALMGYSIRFSKVGRIAAESVMIESGKAVRIWVIAQFIGIGIFFIGGALLLFNEM